MEGFRYLKFGWKGYDASGGTGDLRGASSSLEALQNQGGEREEFEEILDTQTGRRWERDMHDARGRIDKSGWREMEPLSDRLIVPEWVADIPRQEA